MNPPWLNSLRAVAQALAGALPALVIVIGAVLLALLGLACGSSRRNYALDYADRFTALAKVLVGLPHPAEPVSSAPHDSRRRS
jgi:hypothetical protein